MLFTPPGNPTKLKEGIYLLAATIFGAELTFIMGVLAIAVNPHHNTSQKVLLAWTALIILGAVCGFFLGRFWWLKLYVERVWAKKKQ